MASPLEKLPQLPAGFSRYLVGNYAPLAPPLVYGKGSTVYDRDGNDYIDLAAGIAVSSLGHSHPRLVKALANQAQKLIHVSNLFAYDSAARVAKKLTTYTGMEQVFFCNSGAEANEAALKLARKRGVAIKPSKYQIVSLHGSFHGRLGLALAASGQPKLWESFGPQPDGFTHVAPTLEAITATINADTAAFIVEPIQGEGGLVSMPEELLSAVRKHCEQHNALFIVDEIQCGMGRMGKLLATDRSLRPDIITLAKGLGGGVPVGAMLIASQLGGVLQPGDHGTTFGGNALVLAAVEEVLNHVTDQKFQNTVRKRAKLLKARLDEMQTAGAPILEQRGRGLMRGIALDPQVVAAKDAAALAMQAGVMVAPAGDNLLRTMPPLNIGVNELELGCQRLASVLTNARLLKKLKPKKVT